MDNNKERLIKKRQVICNNNWNGGDCCGETYCEYDKERCRKNHNKPLVCNKCNSILCRCCMEIGIIIKKITEHMSETISGLCPVCVYKGFEKVN